MNELQSSFAAIAVIQEQLKTKDQEIGTLQEKSFKNNHALKDIHSLKEHLSATLSPGDCAFVTSPAMYLINHICYTHVFH